MKGTYRIDRQGNEIHVEIKHGTKLSNVILRMMMLFLYVSIFLAGMYYLFRPLFLNYYLHLLIPVFVMMIVFSVNMIWCTKGVERVTIGRDDVKIEHGVWLFRFQRQYQKSKILNLRITDSKDQNPFLSIFEFSNGKICFDYEGKRVCLGDALTIADADCLIEEILNRNQQIIRTSKVN